MSDVKQVQAPKKDDQASQTTATPAPTVGAATARLGSGEPAGAKPPAEVKDDVVLEHEQDGAEDHHMNALMANFAMDNTTFEMNHDPGSKEAKGTELEQTAIVLQNHLDQIGGKDGVVSREDLQKFANDQTADADLRQAAQAVLKDENYLNALDVAGATATPNPRVAIIADRKFDARDLQAVIDNEKNNPQAVTIAQAAGTLRDNWELLDTASGKGGRDGKVSEGDLTAAYNNNQLPEDLHNAIGALLQNKNYRNALDIGTGNGNLDSTFSLNDVSAASNRAGVAQKIPQDLREYQDATLALSKNFDQLDKARGGAGDGFISRDDLQAAAKDPNTNQELRDSINILLNNPEALHALDVGSSKGNVDNLFTRQDLNQFLTTGLDRAIATAEKEKKNYDRFLVETGGLIDPAKLAQSPEARRVKTAEEGLDNLAENFVDVANDPAFQEEFDKGSDEEKAEFYKRLASIDGTPAGAEFAKRLVSNVSKFGEEGESEDPYAKFLEQNQVASLNGKLGLDSSINGLLATQISGLKDPLQASDLTTKFLSGAYGPGALNDPKVKKVVDAFQNYSNAFSNLKGNMQDADLQEQLKKARTDLSEEIKANRGASPALAGLNLATVGFDAAVLANDPWGPNVKTNVALIANAAADTNDLAVLLTKSLGKGATNLAQNLGKATPVLGAAASIATAVADFNKDKVAFSGDVLSGVGYATLLFTGETGVGAVVGGALVVAGSAVNLINLATKSFGQSQDEKDYQDFRNEIIAQSAGDPQKADAISSVRGPSVDLINELAGKNSREPWQELDALYQTYLGKVHPEAGRSLDFNSWLSITYPPSSRNGTDGPH